ncbi:hypothetical protein PHLH8_47410 [Pseudomonas sp. Pc102]|uniref:hypothetical protein n=1 Tax=Pseudomonas sp. Pc102 TaxID=2678261 RepID=UPI001BCE81DC|nr:hypothetical protein [Pseudomonas sp. Pc102]BBP85099.1 hypothetical protein PHLH8_47410 [Pseudomonas sp. Pc102]
MYLVEINQNRPDFRVFIDLLYGARRDVDTDGDANPVYSRTWTHLYLADRESDDPPVDISELEGRPGVYVVESESERLMQLCALYLFMKCGSSLVQNSHALTVDEISALKARYSLELSRADAALWHASSADLPYPNSR